ncbi:MAG: ATP-grasp domain-containing protein [Holophagales bacterium]|nr:ATP-grasp domain-containing protein [Holophagales bacterium]
MPRHVVFLGPDLFSAYVDMVHGLKRAGVAVTGVGHSPSARLDRALARLLDGYVRVPSLLDADALLDAVRSLDRRMTVDRVVTGDEALVVPTAQVREALGLPGLSLRSAQLCRDKPAMKEALRQAGVPCAASDAVSNLDELRRFVEREGFPVILKPRSALGGLGTYRADTVAELERAAGELGVHQGKSVAVEEFVEGHEGFYDTLAVDGEPVHEYISHYYPTVLEALKDRRHSPQIAATNRVELESYDELRQMGRKVIQALGIGTSATHMEWFFGPKGLRFSEIGARPPGERIWDLHSAGNDLSLWTEWAFVEVHGRPASAPSRRFATGSVQIRPDHDGHIAGYDGASEVYHALRPYLIGHRLPPRGTPTDPIHKGYLNNVWFRLRHPDYDELRRLMTFAGERLRVLAS